MAKIPDKQSIYYFCKNVVMRAKMEKETVVICLIYIERLRLKGITLNARNWKRVVFISLILASKV